MDTSRHHTLPEVTSCTDETFPYVKEYIHRYELDNRALKQKEFLVIAGEDGLQAFGRIRQYKGFSELCSLGVLEHLRGFGLGRELVKALMRQTRGPVYVVCIIPDFFIPFGFSHCKTYPPEIGAKLEYCTQYLPVKERYVVLKRN
jgi:N-acetylglutamate synthase-like GNAT family acetyltransferase